MKWLLLATLLASLTVDATEFTITWTPPTENEDNTPLLEQDLDFYTLYINGQPVVNFDSIVGTWTAVIVINEPGTNPGELTVTALNGQESGFSNTVNFLVGPRTPKNPTNLTITQTNP